MSAPAVGSTLVNKYRLLRQLGEGGMATVFEGEHVRLGQKVAIKILNEDLVQNPQLIARFEREGRALCKLKSRHVVRVFDVDEMPSGRPFLVMERLEGLDLDQELAARGSLPIAEAVGYVMQACSAMAEAHALGIIHRDLKPANLFLTLEEGARILKVLDFGIATDAMPDQSARLTRTEAVMGTPVYMAPEQFRDAKNVDARADIWALGATLYELLTGTPPFSGTASTIGIAVVFEAYPPIENTRPDVPVELRAVIARTLEKDKANRFSTIEQLAEALSPFGESIVIAPRSSGRALVAARERDLEQAMTHPLVAPAPAAVSPAPAAAATVAPAPRAFSVRRIAAGLAAVTVVGVAAIMVSMTRSSHAPAAGQVSLPHSEAMSATPSASVVPVATVDTNPGSPSASVASPSPSVAASASAPRASGAAVATARTTPASRPSASAVVKPSSKPGTSATPPLFFPGQ